MATMVSINEAAEHLHMTSSGLYNQRTQGHKPGTLGVKIGRRILFHLKDLDDWIETEKVRQRSELESRNEVA